ncbi:MAG: DMT family transporter [Actinobacteria bacterium]|nr:DMT family transporter [Actinomycetota bacterium]
MPALWVIVLVAAAGGAAVALQAQLVGLIDTRLGTLEAIFFTYGVGGVLAAALMLLARGGNLAEWRELPGYAYLAGVFGLVIIGAISYGVARLGVVRGLLLVTLSQFLVSALIDQFGLFGADVQPVTLHKIAGILLLLAGGWLVLR